MVNQFFVEGPAGAWRPSVRAVHVYEEDDTLMGRLLYTNGRRSHPVGYERAAIERNLAAGEWRQVSADEVLTWRSDKPQSAGAAW